MHGPSETEILVVSEDLARKSHAREDAVLSNELGIRKQSEKSKIVLWNVLSRGTDAGLSHCPKTASSSSTPSPCYQQVRISHNQSTGQLSQSLIYNLTPQAGQTTRLLWVVPTEAQIPVQRVTPSPQGAQRWGRAILVLEVVPSA